MKSIEFNTWSMQRLIRGVKTQTRRKMKPQPEKIGALWRWKNTAWCDGRALVSDVAPVDLCPYGQPGELLWVKEQLVCVVGGGWAEWCDAGYLADEIMVKLPDGKNLHWRWKRNKLPARFCPREASRFTIELTDVRVERVQDITEGDAIREGCMYAGHGDDWQRRDAFSTIWESIHGEGAWERNEWVWVLGFEVEP